MTRTLEQGQVIWKSVKCVGEFCFLASIVSQFPTGHKLMQLKLGEVFLCHLVVMILAMAMMMVLSA